MSRRRWIMVKSSPKQVGFGKLSTVEAHFKNEEIKEKAAQVRDGWRRLFPHWTFRIVDPEDFGYRGKYETDAMYDDVMTKQKVRA